MNGMTEEDYELELLGVNEDDDTNSEDEHQEIEEALYQAMHYSESIAANASIHEVTDNQEENSGTQHSKDELASQSIAHSHTASPQKLDSKEDAIKASDRIALPRHQDSRILVDEDDISKFLSMCRKACEFKSKSLDFNSVKNIKDIADESSDYESDTEVIRPNLKYGILGESSPTCDPNKNNVLKDFNNKTSKKNTNIDDRLLEDSESDDDCCIIIESTSEDENLQVHFASNDDTDKSPSKKQTKKPARYFEEPTSKNVKGKCYNCHETGHHMSDCPEEKKPQACIMCGVQGHYYKACPNQLCYNCDSPGHENKSCTKKRIHWNTVCKRCYMNGHEMATCADRWRQFHLTTKSRPRLLYGAEEIMKQMYCYNCGKEGHLGYECTAERMDRYVKVNYPFVCNYSYKSFVCTAYKTTHNETEVSFTLPTEHEPSDITNSKGKGKKKKKKKEKLLQTVETRQQQEEKDLEIVISKAGKKRKINCKKTKEVQEKKRGAEQIEETETRANENKKQKKKSKKKKKVETETNAKEGNDVGTTAPSSEKDKTLDDDDNVIYLETVSTRKRVAEEDIIVLSSDGESSNEKTDVIVISDDSVCKETPRKRKKRKTEKTAVCEDQDVIILPGSEERNDENGILCIEDDEEDNDNSRTPLGLVWGFPDVVVRNNKNQIPKKIKKLFSENMRIHNQPPTRQEKKRRYRLKQRNRMSNAGPATADLAIAKKKFQKRRKREKKMQLTEPQSSKNKQGKKKKGVMQTPLNIPKVKVEFSNHQPGTSSRFVVSADRSRYKWFKKKDVNLNQTS